MFKELWRLRRRGAGLRGDRDERQRARRGDGRPGSQNSTHSSSTRRPHDRGIDILRNFAYEICGRTGDWTMASFVKEATDRISGQVGRAASFAA